VLLPAHAYYHFHATSEEPLVLLRVGCKAGEGDMSQRLNIKGGAMPGHHPDNKQVEVIYNKPSLQVRRFRDAGAHNAGISFSDVRKSMTAASKAAGSSRQQA
jgi:hypothetical protein